MYIYWDSHIFQKQVHYGVGSMNVYCREFYSKIKTRTSVLVIGELTGQYGSLGQKVLETDICLANLLNEFQKYKPTRL